MTTLADAQSNLAAAQTAYRRALDARSVGFGDRSVQRQDITALRAEVQHWQREVDRLTAAAPSRVRGLILRS